MGQGHCAGAFGASRLVISFLSDNPSTWACTFSQTIKRGQSYIEARQAKREADPVLSKNSNGGNALHFLGLAFRNDWPFAKNFSLQNDAEGSIAE